MTILYFEIKIYEPEQSGVEGLRAALTLQTLVYIDGNLKLSLIQFTSK